ncbi:hypothetical protein BG000_002616 [Podila horticola]|nr:hypothetical protein BG000_002616 [Podila horticola]
MTFTGVPLRTVFYFIAFMALIMAIFYTIYIARRDRRRRRRNRAQDTEAGRHTSTYRPETDEGKFTDPNGPPGYRSYMLDQPYVDPEMVVIYPQDAHFDQHLNALERHLTMENAINNRSLVSSVTTTTTTTFMPEASSGVRSVEDSETPTEPVFVARPEGLVATSSLTGSTSGTSNTPTVGASDSMPVIAEPAPTASFLSGRHLSILRFGLGGSNNIHSGSGSSSSHRNSRHSQTSSPSGSRPPSPTLSSPRSSVALLMPESTSDQLQMAELTTSSSRQHPILHRLRSQGPPPYIPSTEEAPPLPPSYNTVEVPQ